MFQIWTGPVQFNADEFQLCGSVELTIHATPTIAFTAQFLVGEPLVCDMLWGDHLLGGRQLDTVIDLGRRSLHSRRLGLTMPLEYAMAADK